MRPDRQRGFTLIEAIIAMVITGIVAGIVSVFIVQPVTAYLDSVRRAGMTDVADTALRRIAYDVRLAVPNSVRVDASRRFVEFIPTQDGGRYRAQRDAAGCAAPTPTDPILNADDCSAADNNRFDVLGPDVAGVAGDFVVIFNTGQAGLDAYEGGIDRNRRTLSANAASKVAFTPTTALFPRFESPFQRFQLVPASGPVSFGCTAVAAPAGFGTFELWRFTSYRAAGSDDWSVQPTAVAGSSALLASDLDDCNFEYAALSAANGLLIVRLAVLREGERVSLVHEIHVDNTP